MTSLTPLSPGPELRQIAAIGDGRTIALVGPDGTIPWMCVPDIDSPPLFDALVDLGGGAFSIHPVEPFEATHSYRRDSNVREIVFTTASGSIRLTDSLNSTFAGRLPWCELARRIEGLTGTVHMRITIVFGTRAEVTSPWLEPTPNGNVFHVGPVLGLVRMSPNVRIFLEDDRRVEAEVTLATDERAIVALIAGENEPLGFTPIADIDARLDVSDVAWRTWAEGIRYEGRYRNVVRRSALALKLLLFSPSGAIAAAATTSLPERIGGEKNFDYRFAWVRDAGYTINAFLRLGIVPESKAALSWLLHRLGSEGARVCYTLHGGTVPPPTTLDVSGYRDSRPVVRGNAATHQHQHGIYGDIFETVSIFVGSGNVLDHRSAAILAALANECTDRWRQPDSGMWELPEQQHYTMSKISAWQALARAVELGEAGHLPDTCVPRWRRERDRIAEWVDAHCWSEAKRAYTFYAGTDRLDASLTLAVPFGFDGRERLSSTCDALRRELGSGPHLYRYSGAAHEEGAFIACTFWMVEALAFLDRTDEAQKLMDEALAAFGGGSDILSEMVDPSKGTFLGNIPQGLSHLALIHAAYALDVGTDRIFGRKRG